MMPQWKVQWIEVFLGFPWVFLGFSLVFLGFYRFFPNFYVFFSKKLYVFPEIWHGSNDPGMAHIFFVKPKVQGCAWPRNPNIWVLVTFPIFEKG